MNTPLLTVITLHLPHRAFKLQELRAILGEQIAPYGDVVEHLIISDSSVTYGELMGRSVRQARGQYVCWMDDDDLPEPEYVDEIMKAIRTEPAPDVVTFASYSPRPNGDRIWARLRFGAKDNEFEDGQGVTKSANHYCAWRREIAASAVWLPRNYGAEYIWYTSLRLAYPNLREVYIPKLLHRYVYNAADTRCQNATSIGRSLANGGNVVHILKGVEDGRLYAAVGPHQPRNGIYRAYTPELQLVSLKKSEVMVLEVASYR